MSGRHVYLRGHALDNIVPDGAYGRTWVCTCGDTGPGRTVAIAKWAHRDHVLDRLEDRNPGGLQDPVVAMYALAQTLRGTGFAFADTATFREAVRATLDADGWTVRRDGRPRQASHAPLAVTRAQSPKLAVEPVVDRSPAEVRADLGAWSQYGTYGGLVLVTTQRCYGTVPRRVGDLPVSLVVLGADGALRGDP